LPENVEDISSPAPSQGFGSELFWRALATVILVTVLWILWLLWQISPISAVNPIVFQIQHSRQSSVGTIQRAPASASGDGAQGGQPQPQGVAPNSALSTGSPLGNLKMETELRVPPVRGAQPNQ
jgi:hypothetical protein